MTDPRRGFPTPTGARTLRIVTDPLRNVASPARHQHPITVRVPADEPRWARRLYGAIAFCYDWFRPIWVARKSDRDLDELLRTTIRPGDRLLELAPGTGRNLRRLLELQPQFGSYLGVDISPAMIRRAARHARRNGEVDPRIVLLEGDVSVPHRIDWSAVSRMTGQDGSEPVAGPPFDGILSTWLLAHLERPQDTVASALGLLAPGGTAIFLFFVEPRFRLRRWIVALFVSLFRGRFVDLDALRRRPECVDGRSYPAAHLLVFRAPDP